jgi:hypothetical protein
MKKKSKSVVVAQKAPKKNKTPAMWDLVMADIKERDKNGKAKYGVRLQAFNGRDATIDAYQEVLDLIVYFRQLVEEKKELVTFLKSLLIENHQDSMRTLQTISPKARKLLEKLGEAA